MKKIRVAKSIKDALNAEGYAEGKKFVYVVHDELSPNCIVVMRFPRFVRADSLVEFIQVKGLEHG